MDVKAGNAEKAAAKIDEGLRKLGGKLIIPLPNTVKSTIAGYQQFSYIFPVSKTAKMLKVLRRAGSIGPVLKTAVPPFEEDAEVREKMESLKRDTEADRGALSKMPSISAMVAEEKKYLLSVQAARAEAPANIHLNITVSLAQPGK